MSAGTEIERLLVRLVGDATSYQRMLKESEVATKRTMTSIERMGDRMERVGRSINKAGRSMQRLGRSLALRITAPLAIIGGLGVRAFAKFDNAMVESTSIMQTTGNQVKRMRQLALDLGSTGKQGPADLAEAYFFLASAGLDAEASMAALPVVSQFATAGAFDMALATDLLTDAQQAMGLASEDAAVNLANLTRVGDVFVKANQSANTSVQQVAEALTSDAGTAARGFGASLETTVAVLDAYASAGKKGAEAGNLFGRATRLLASAQMKNGAAFQKFGIDVIDEATGEYRNFIDIIGDMETAFGSLTKPEIKRALSDLGFEALAQKSIAPLIGLTSQMKKYEQQMIDAGGAAKEVADKQMKSFSNQMIVLWNNITVVGIRIGEILAPAILWLNGVIQRGIEMWKTWSPAVQKTIVIIGVLAAAIGPLLIVFGGIVALIGAAITGLGVILPTLAAIVTPVTAAITAVVALGVAIIGLIAPWDVILSAVKKFFKVAIGFISNFRENVTILWSWLKDNWIAILEDIARAWIVMNVNMLSNLVTAFHTMFRLWVVWQGFMVGLFQRIFTKEFVKWVIRGIVIVAEKFAKLALFALAKLKEAFGGKKVSFTAFVKQIKGDFESGRGATTLRELGEEMGKVIGEGMGKMRNPLEGFETAIKGPNLKIGAGAAEKLAEQMYPRHALEDAVNDAVDGADIKPIVLSFLAGREATTIGSLEAERRMMEFNKATEGGNVAVPGVGGGAVVAGGPGAGAGAGGGPAALQGIEVLQRIATATELMAEVATEQTDETETTEFAL